MLEELIKKAKDDDELAAFLSIYIDALYDEDEENDDVDKKTISKSKKKVAKKVEKEDTAKAVEEKPKAKVTKKKTAKKAEKEDDTKAVEEKPKAKVTKKKTAKKAEKEDDTKAVEENPKAKVTKKKTAKKVEKEDDVKAVEEKLKAKVTKKKTEKKVEKEDTAEAVEEKPKAKGVKKKVAKKSSILDDKKKKMKIHEIAKEGIEKHINELCIDACQSLWDKNIYTKAIKVDDEKIEIVLDKLDQENISVFEKRMKKDIDKYLIDSENEYIIKIDKADKLDKTIKTELKNSVKYFILQDVETGYLDKQKFLMNICDCEKVEGMKENAKKLNLEIVFDENKMEKTFEEYLKEKDYEDLYLEDENRIYLDKYYLDGHINYLKSKEK